MTESMDTRLRKAIDNNHGLYRAVFENHGVSFTVEEEIAYTLSEPPPLHSNLVTRSQTWRPDATFNTIDRRAEEQRWGGWSIKDSFNVLDLVPYGFEKLFRAQWIYLPADRFVPITGPESTYKVLDTTDELAAWISAWGATETIAGEEIFHPNLLKNPTVHFVGRYESGSLTSGCLVNATNDVLGISNFFAAGEPSVPLWSSVIVFIHEAIGRKDIVGYERPEFAAELGVLGYEVPGDLAAWLKRKPRAS